MRTLSSLKLALIILQLHSTPHPNSPVNCSPTPSLIISFHWIHMFQCDIIMYKLDFPSSLINFKNTHFSFFFDVHYDRNCSIGERLGRKIICTTIALSSITVTPIWYSPKFFIIKYFNFLIYLTIFVSPSHLSWDFLPLFSFLPVLCRQGEWMLYGERLLG